MRKSVILLAPLLAAALVAGCKGKEPEAGASEAASTAAITAPAALPALTANAKAGGAYAGTYSQTGADGKVSTLKLTAGDTFEWTGADGKAAAGKVSWYKDGSTILLLGEGNKAVFAIADGGVYKLANNEAPRTGLTAEQLFTKAP